MHPLGGGPGREGGAVGAERGRAAGLGIGFGLVGGVPVATVNPTTTNRTKVDFIVFTKIYFQNVLTAWIFT
jgi:hypothetical protein